MNTDVIANIINGANEAGVDIDFSKSLDYNEWEQRKVDRYNEGTGNLNKIDGINCGLCKNRGYYAKINTYGDFTLQECKCITKRRTMQKAQKSGLGTVLSSLTFDKYEAKEEWQKDIKDKAIKFTTETGDKWFFIGGQVGAGKTHICTAICGNFIKQGKNVKYMLWTDESKRLKAIVNDDTEYSRAVEELKTVDVLYIDDFLKVKAGEKPTAGDINLAFEILNRRMINNEITVISSEKTILELMDVDEALMSRVYQKTGEYKINIEKDVNKNYRLR